MMRYMHRLESKDLSLTTSMIPLGSCTMKLNSAAEMMPLSWPEVNRIHPFAPSDQWLGYAGMIADLESWLAAATGFSAVSVQPNAGSQGEYAGLLAIRAWHRSNENSSRDICLIPTSAHGPNPASAVMAGMKVVPVKCDSQGNVDLADLEAKAVGQFRPARRCDGHLSFHARRLRGRDSGSQPDRPRPWRAGLHGRGESECPGGDRVPRRNSGPMFAI